MTPRPIATVDLGVGPVAVEVIHAQRHPDAPQGGMVVGMPPLWVRVGGGEWHCAGSLPALDVQRLGLRIAEQRKELARLRSIAREHVDLYREAQDAADAAAADRDALRAIVAGQPRAPSDAEIAAHALDHPQRYAMAQGAWLVMTGDLDLIVAHGQEWSSATELRHPDTGRRIDDVRRAWPLASDGAPCAWPVVDGVVEEPSDSRG